MNVWRLEVRHETGYRYESDVTESYNEVRLSPIRSAYQWVLDHRIDVFPAARLSRFTDYWGSHVHSFDLHRADRELTIVATSYVETADAVVDFAGTGLTWSELVADDIQDEWCELLMPTPLTEPDDAIDGLADLIRSAPDPRSGIRLADQLARERLTYQRGATNVSTTAAEALAGGEGVCQDFVHVTLAALRRAGIPCRYSSGYLLPDVDAPFGESTAGESHAWLEAWLGDWCAIDPTNGEPVGPEHVLIARGRDYSDVPPLRGVYQGGTAQALDVTVQITRQH